MKPLTPRQVEVMRLVADGLTRDEIADDLGISRSTIDKHLTEAYRRLGAENRALAVGRAVLRGIVDDAGSSNG